MSNHDNLLSEFISITKVDEEKAKFFLESSAWELEVALTSFYENDGNDVPPVEEAVIDSAEETSQSQSSIKVTASQSKDKKKSNVQFGTVQTLNSPNSSDEEGQAFYAGGSEHSGQQVLGPSKKKDFVAEMFKSVQEHGGEVVEPHGSEKSQAFVGTGYKLGASSSDSVVVAGSSQSAPITEVVLKLWREGFSLNDGNLREYADPENREFLECIRNGEIPTELIRASRGNEVHLSMEDHRREEFLASKPKLQPFSGKGHTLGSPTPVAVGAPSSQEQDKEANERAAKDKVNINRSEPTTSLQIRLADGSRLFGEFNQTHTIADVRDYITIARPQFAGQNFILITTFPNRNLTDEKQTLKEAELLNVAIIQRLK